MHHRGDTVYDTRAIAESGGQRDLLSHRSRKHANNLIAGEHFVTINIRHNHKLACRGHRHSLADKLVEYCGKVFADVGDFSYNPDHDSFNDGIFTVDTKTVGGMQ